MHIDAYVHLRMNASLLNSARRWRSRVQQTVANIWWSMHEYALSPNQINLVRQRCYNLWTLQCYLIIICSIPYSSIPRVFISVTPQFNLQPWTILQKLCSQSWCQNKFNLRSSGPGEVNEFSWNHELNKLTSRQWNKLSKFNQLVNASEHFHRSFCFCFLDTFVDWQCSDHQHVFILICLTYRSYRAPRLSRRTLHERLRAAQSVCREKWSKGPCSSVFHHITHQFESDPKGRFHAFPSCSTNLTSGKFQLLPSSSAKAPNPRVAPHGLIGSCPPWPVWRHGLPSANPTAEMIDDQWSVR